MLDTPGILKERDVIALDRDPASLAVVFEWYRPRLYARALRICGNSPAAKDAVQDTFIKAFTQIHALKNPDSIYPWLRRILINNCLQLNRREQYAKNAGITFASDRMIRQGIDEHFDRVSHQQQVYAVLHQLSEELRSCVLLRFFSNYDSYNDIAQILGIPQGTVRSRLPAARKKLEALYQKYEDAGDKAFREATEWSGYYRELWANMYDDAQARNELFQHLDPAISIRFTSGKSGKGRRLIEKEISDDLYYGSRFIATEIITCANISIVEGVNINTSEIPDRCPPSSVLILFRKGVTAKSFHIHDSQKEIYL